MKTLLFLKYSFVLLFLISSLVSFVTPLSIQKFPGVVRMKLKRNSEVYHLLFVIRTLQEKFHTKTIV